MAIFFRSEDVKVFPCAYRGESINTSTNPIDPDARAFTEYNFSNIYSKVSDSKSSYIISFENDILKCVIGGYYFEINTAGYTKADFKYLAIKLKAYDSENNKTNVLADYNSANIDYLDSNGYFKGLRGLSEYNIQSETATYVLQVWEAAGSNLILCEQSKRLEDTFDVDTGKFAIKTKDNSTASGKHAIALGTNISAEHAYSTLIGANLKSSAPYQVVFGTGQSSNNPAIPSTDTAFQLVNSGTNLICIKNNGDVETKAITIEESAVTINGTVEVSEALTAQKEAKIRKSLEVSETITANGGITGNDGAIITKTANEKTGTTTINENGLYVTGDVGNISSSGPITSASGINVETQAGGKVFTADWQGNINISGNITAVKNDAVRTLTLGGTAQGQAGEIKVYKGAANAELFVADANNIKLNNPTSIAGTLTATGNASLGGELAVATKISGDRIIITAPDKYEQIGGGDTTVTTDDIYELRALCIQDTKTANNKTVHNNLFSVDVHGNVVAAGAITTPTAVIGGKEFKIATTSINDLTPSTQSTGLVINNANAFVLATGIHTSGPITIKNAAANADSITSAIAINDTTGKLTAKVSPSGDAYLARRLIIGGTKEDVNISDSDTISTYISKLDSGCNLWVDTNRLVTAGKVAIGNDTYIGGHIETGSESHLYIGSVIKLNDNNNNGIIANYYNTPSDIRLKQNVKNYESPKSILELDVKEFEYINDPTHKKHIGCIAQDLQEICPEIVYQNSDGYLAIEESKLVFLLLNEVKKLKKEISILKGE